MSRESLCGWSDTRARCSSAYFLSGSIVQFCGHGHPRGASIFDCSSPRFGATSLGVARRHVPRRIWTVICDHCPRPARREPVSEKWSRYWHLSIARAKHSFARSRSGGSTRSPSGQRRCVRAWQQRRRPRTICARYTDGVVSTSSANAGSTAFRGRIW